jgi:DNA-binding beta-propeller fold protein YncE
MRTLKVTKEIPADLDADALALDPSTGHLFVVEGDPAALTVIDPKSDAPIATIKAGEKLEFAVSDGHGAIYVAGEANGDVLKIDAKSNTIAGRWPTPGCTSPHGIAVDARAHRVFMGCINSVMMVVDATTGRTVAKLPIGRGSDAVAFDPVRKRVFSSNGADGTITAYQQVSPDNYAALRSIPTMVSARTMSVDPATGRLFVAGADTDPNPTPGGRPHVRPGTLRLLIFKPSA